MRGEIKMLDSFVYKLKHEENFQLELLGCMRWSTIGFVSAVLYSVSTGSLRFNF